MPSIRTILHPTDLSDNSRNAFETACDLARDHQARLLLLHVVLPTVASFGPMPNPLEPAESPEAVVRWGFAWPQLPDSQLRVEHHVAEGDATEEILRLARTVSCDLIVMGTHGRTGLGRLWAGSVAEEVLRKATCPVLVVKPTLPQTPSAETEAAAQPGDIVEVLPLGATLTSASTKTLAKSAGLEIIRLVVPAGQNIPEHKAPGNIVVQCLEGCVRFSALGRTQNLEAGELLYLPPGEAHAIQGVKNAALLLTIFRFKP